MYNKLFSKILDSSLWLQDDTTRIVWITLLAAMDEDGFVAFSSAKNLAHRARVALDAAEAAITYLESPDTDSSNPSNEGRRIERVDGGWMVLNASEYRMIASRAIKREQTRTRVAEFRERKRGNSINGEYYDKDQF